ncbi:MAG: DUF1223 domain-containing protein [Caulobacterales bacterium]|nr:DUF1223 domain-containing protein [Caulobacterales bacterium]
MRKAALLSLILLACPAALAWPTGASAARAGAGKAPVLVELFTAQGCGKCKDANAYFGKLADRPGVLGLTYSVDYWDYLGWADTFARPEFAERQKAYVARLKLREPYTPQVVVDGRDEAQGLKTTEVDKLVRAAAAAPRDPPEIHFVGNRRVDVGSARAPKGGADVWLIRYDPRAVEVAVKAGDNRGETVVERNVVREMTRLGAWKGKPQAFRLPPPEEEGLKTVVVLQGPKGGRVLAVGQAKG